MTHHASAQQRLSAKSVAIPECGCHVWLGAVNDDGYGRISVGAINKHAHRVSYELTKGPIPAGLVLDHLCRVRCCVNPEHLEPVTIAENVRRGLMPGMRGKAKSARTHCSHGHEYTPDNTAWRNNSRWRVCKTCIKQQRNAP